MTFFRKWRTLEAIANLNVTIEMLALREGQSVQFNEHGRGVTIGLLRHCCKSLLFVLPLIVRSVSWNLSIDVSNAPATRPLIKPVVSYDL